MTNSMHIGIAGAGLLGRLLAWRLARAGHAVQVFDAAAGPEPVFRSQAPEQGYVPTAAGFTAAGMLSPMAELDNAEPGVAALGWRSIALWRRIVAALPTPQPLLSVQGSLLLAHRGDAGAAQRVLDRLHAATMAPAIIAVPAHAPNATRNVMSKTARVMYRLTPPPFAPRPTKKPRETSRPPGADS